MITAVKLHKAYAAVERCVSAWSAEKTQKSAQTEQIVMGLARLGLLANAKIDGQFVVESGAE